MFVPFENILLIKGRHDLHVRNCKSWASTRRLQPLRREGSLSCLTYCKEGPLFTRSCPKNRPVKSPFTISQGDWRPPQNESKNTQKYPTHNSSAIGQKSQSLFETSLKGKTLYAKIIIIYL